MRMTISLALVAVLQLCAVGIVSSVQSELPYGQVLPNATIKVDLNNKINLADTLYGVFFEEIEHAGDGGLYAEMVQDTSFDALAAATGFLAPTSTNDGYTTVHRPSSSIERLNVDWNELAASFPSATEPLNLGPRKTIANKTYTTKSAYYQDHPEVTPRSNNLIVAWTPLPGTQSVLTKDIPLNEHNRVAMELSVGAGVDVGGLVNSGYWGISLQNEESYSVSLYLRNPGENDVQVTVSLMGADLTTKYAEVSFNARGGKHGAAWTRHEGQLLAAATDNDARLVISFEGPATLVIDSVSLFPTENVEEGKARGHLNPYPFRKDLLDAIKELNPGFLRFPGGCFVEGDWLRNRVYFKDGLGHVTERPGHFNLWGYWSTDSLGLFEYMVLVDELKTEPIWVINNGVAHSDSIPAAVIWPMVQDALDSIEFITGPADSEWGSVRASMGREEPWSLKYMAIGNEDCGKPFYLENYNLFYGAIKAKYPDITLISNCDMGNDAPTDLYDWHIYTNPGDMFNKRREFDGQSPENGAHFVFASEYAVTDGGGWGNLVAAVSEAAFMTGMERNGRIVHAGAYAPLFVHTNDRVWPTNAIVFDNHQYYVIPSYHVQKMFRAVQGAHYADTSVVEDPTSSSHEEKVAASATCQNEECSVVAVKIINFSSYKLTVNVDLNGLPSGMQVASSGQVTILTGEHPEDENSFAEPSKIAPVTEAMEGLSSNFDVQLKPYSVNVVMLNMQPAPSAIA